MTLFHIVIHTFWLGGHLENVQIKPSPLQIMFGSNLFCNPHFLSIFHAKFYNSYT